MPQIPLCNFSGAKFLIFGDSVPPLIYYSHLPIALFSLCLGIFVLFKGYQKRSNLLLFVMTVAFSIWVFLDSIFWASNRSDVIMTAWAIILLIEPVVHAASLLLAYNLLKKEGPSFLIRLTVFALFVPLILLVPTKYSLVNFDIGTCLATEGPIALYYTYLMEGIFTLWLVIFGIIEYRRAKDVVEKRKVRTLIVGLLLFLIAFSWGNIVGSFTEDWN